MESKRVLCSSCDIYCQVQVDVDGGRVVRVKAVDPRPLRSNICMKGVHAPSGFAHPDRVLHPLKRIGERGGGRWGARHVGRGAGRDRGAAPRGGGSARAGGPRGRHQPVEHPDRKRRGAPVHEPPRNAELDLGGRSLRRQHRGHQPHGVRLVPVSRLSPHPLYRALRPQPPASTAGPRSTTRSAPRRGTGRSSSCSTRGAPRTRSKAISGCRFGPGRTPRCASDGSR